MSNVKVPAVSHELIFIATYTDEADDIYDENIKVDPLLKDLSDAVYDRADADAYKLLDYLKDSIEEGTKQHFRINKKWHQRIGSWEAWSEIYSGVRGRRKWVGQIGLDVGYGGVGFRLIGSMNPRRGGLDERRKLVLALQKKIKQAHLTSDHVERYPKWPDCIVWLDKKLTLQTSREELWAEVTKQARALAAVTEPFLKHT